MKNSRGLKVSKEHLNQRAKENAYLDEMVAFLNKKGNKVWNNELRDEYNAILLKYGYIKGMPKNEV